MNNFHLIVLDGVGVGELPDADVFGDQGSNTLGNISKAVGGLNLPNLESFGLGNLTEIIGVNKNYSPIASYGKMTEVSPGKDSTTGHWEIGGLKVDFDFPYYPNGFPEEIVNKFLKEANLKGILGNKAASGTEIIKELGNEHVRTGFPIIYTSADSVFQIAAHEDIIPLERLYEICKAARFKVFKGKDSIGRVIARPFLGERNNYKRTTNRKDFSINPTSPTILNVCQEKGIKTVAIGKVNDLFNNYGIDENIMSKSNEQGIHEILKASETFSNSFIFTNLVDFDVYFGHRNDPEGFANALKYFDEKLPEIIDSLDETDALAITADHGNDPTTPSTDHSREYVPVLFYRKGKPGRDLGIRNTFSDLGQTVAHFFKLNNTLKGNSFLE